MNGRYYVRFYYDYDQDLNNIQINKTYYALQDQYNITAWLNLTNNVKYNLTYLLNSKSTTTIPKIGQQSTQKILTVSLNSTENSGVLKPIYES